MTNREWIAKGNTGCAFATLFAKDPDKIGWKFIDYKDWEVLKRNLPDTNIISILFPTDIVLYKGELGEKRSIVTWKDIKGWAVSREFYLESTSDTTQGLRIFCPHGVAWVQYFGPDSHVVTRRSPQPMLTFTCRLNATFYLKVGFQGILHLAHAWYSKISDRVYDLLWERSHKQTRKKIGRDLGIEEAAKTTFLIKNR